MRITIDNLLKAINNSNGIVSTIAKRLGVSWHTAFTYIKKSRQAEEAYNDECNKVLDYTENKLFEAIEKGDSGLIKFYLMTKGRGRGYTYEEIENKESGDTLPAINIIMSK